MIRVLLADDHVAMRTGLRHILEQNEDIEVVAETDSGELANEIFNDVLPCVLVMDVSMPGIGGLEALKRILVRHQNAKVILYSMYENVTIATQAISSGAMLILKNPPTQKR